MDGGSAAGSTAFTSYGLGINTSLNDLHLQSASPARNVGANLSTYFTADADGVSRPGGSTAWEIGAYQYVGITPTSLWTGSVTGAIK